MNAHGRPKGRSPLQGATPDSGRAEPGAGRAPTGSAGSQIVTLTVSLDDALLSLDELCRVQAVTPQWVMERVEAGLLPTPQGAPRGWRFDATLVQRVRCMARIERDFDAGPELAALVADLLDEVERLRGRLRRLGAG